MQSLVGEVEVGRRVRKPLLGQRAVAVAWKASTSELRAVCWGRGPIHAWPAFSTPPWRGASEGVQTPVLAQALGQGTHIQAPCGRSQHRNLLVRMLLWPQRAPSYRGRSGRLRRPQGEQRQAPEQRPCMEGQRGKLLAWCKAELGAGCSCGGRGGREASEG